MISGTLGLESGAVCEQKKLPCGGTAEEPHGFCGPHESELVQRVSEWHMRCSTASLHKALGEHTLRKDNNLKNIKNHCFEQQEATLITATATYAFQPVPSWHLLNHFWK